jgi:hypothetical protein
VTDHQEKASMQEHRSDARRAEATAAFEELPTDGAAFSARVAAMSPAERQATFPLHSDGQVCR